MATESPEEPRRGPRAIKSNETLVLAECAVIADEDNYTRVFNRCISLEGRALLRLVKVSGSEGESLYNNDVIRVECGFGPLVLRGHSMSKYVSWKYADKHDKSLFRIEGLEPGQELLSSMSFNLASVYWPSCYLSKKSRVTTQYYGSGPERTLVQQTRECLILAKNRRGQSDKMSMVNLCALPARLSNRQQPSSERLLARIRSSNFAAVSQFRTVSFSRMKQRTVHVDKLKPVTVPEEEDHPLLDKECSICLSEFEPGEVCCTMPCAGGHQFHRGCISKWLQCKTSCPLCNEAFPNVVSEHPFVHNQRPAELPAPVHRSSTM